EPGVGPAGGAVDRFLDESRALGGDACYVPADVSTADGAERVVEAARQRYGGPHAILHAAAVLRDGLLRDSPPQAAREIALPKIAGLLNLAHAAAGTGLELVVLFSSLSAVTGNPGQADYAAANRFLDGYAEERHPYRVVSVNWPPWRGGGMAVPAAQAEALRRAGFGLLPDEEGLDLLEACLAGDRAQVTVVWGDPERIRTRPE